MALMREARMAGCMFLPPLPVPVRVGTGHLCAAALMGSMGSGRPRWRCRVSRVLGETGLTGVVWDFPAMIDTAEGGRIMMGAMLRRDVGNSKIPDVPEVPVSAVPRTTGKLLAVACVEAPSRNGIPRFSYGRLKFRNNTNVVNFRQ